jgi:hypothetical protein
MKLKFLEHSMIGLDDVKPFSVSSQGVSQFVIGAHEH